MKNISSKNNSIFKNISKLLFKNNKRKASNSFIVEGIKDINLCHNYGFEFIEIIICSELISNQNINYIDTNFNNVVVYNFSLKLYQELIYKKKGDGLLALIKSKDNSLKNFKISKNPYILIAESPEKPGNIGALLRTADAAHLDAVIIANPKTDLYNPNIIRSSVGCVFTNQIAIGSTVEILSFLQKKQINIFRLNNLMSSLGLLLESNPSTYLRHFFFTGTRRYYSGSKFGAPVSSFYVRRFCHCSI